MGPGNSTFSDIDGPGNSTLGDCGRQDAEEHLGEGSI